MKRQFLLLAGTVFTSATLLAQTGQISNNGFNQWESTGYNPTDWATVASALPTALDALGAGAFAGMLVPQFAPTAEEEQTDKVEGSSSVKLTTIATPSMAVQYLGPATPGLLGLGELDLAAAQSGSPVLLTGATFPYKPDTIIFQYKYTPAGTDTATLILNFTKQGSDVAGGVITRNLLSTGGAWQTETIVISSWSDAPDNAVFQISSGWQQGSVLYVDDLYFGYTTPPVAIPTVSVSTSADTIAEGGSATFTVTLSEAATVALSVPVQFSGTAVSTDYTASATSFDFPVGQTSATITVSAATDTEVEGDETVVLTLLPDAGNAYVLDATSSSKTLVITDVTETGIKETAAMKAISLYPNPASANVSIVVPSEVATQNVAITDLNGKILATKNAVSGTTSFNVSNFANGSYVIVFTNATTNTFTGSKQLQIAK